MELQDLVSTVATVIAAVDVRPPRPQKPAYIPSVGTITEDQLRDAVRAHINDQKPPTWWAQPEVPYQDTAGARCDLVITPISGEAHRSWAIEFKKIAFVGDNGKNNDFGPSKVLSPYPIHRSSILDARRLETERPAARGAVIMYGFDFDADVVASAYATCERLGIEDTRARELQRTLDRNGGDYYVDATFRVFDVVARELGCRLSQQRANASFGPLSAHPIYRRGAVAAWEVLGTWRPPSAPLRFEFDG
ncbi:MAG: hypothetical protein JNM10_17355 [Planctomycetia bacterium]|nr:hypothetical protein [Planctomycetia bacterium]